MSEVTDRYEYKITLTTCTKLWRSPVGILTSCVVGRERMGKAFPHKKLSGNGVPTREILRDIFLLAIFHYRHVMTFSAPESISKLDIRKY